MHSLDKQIITIIAAFLATFPLKAQNPAEKYTDNFRNWIKVIGSDEFGGRKPMSPYETKTIEYLAGEFRNLGLAPAFDGSYFQSVKEISTTVRLPENGIPVKTARGTVRLSSPEDLMVWTTRVSGARTSPRTAM